MNTSISRRELRRWHAWIIARPPIEERRDAAFEKWSKYPKWNTVRSKILVWTWWHLRKMCDARESNPSRHDPRNGGM